MTDLSLIIPVHNERDNIQPLFEEICAALDNILDYEVIYVDDGSNDGTTNILDAICRDSQRLRVIHHRHRLGQSASIVSGVKSARAAWVATLDGDGQNDPADIETLLAIRDNAQPEANLQLVIGNRCVRKDSRLKRMSSRIANYVRGKLLNDGTPDTGCGLKLFRRDAFLALPFFDHMHRFLPALFKANSGGVFSVRVVHRSRIHGQSHYGVNDRLWVGIADLFGVMWLQRRIGRIFSAGRFHDK